MHPDTWAAAKEQCGAAEVSAFFGTKVQTNRLIEPGKIYAIAPQKLSAIEPNFNFGADPWRELLVLTVALELAETHGTETLPAEARLLLRDFERLVEAERASTEALRAELRRSMWWETGCGTG